MERERGNKTVGNVAVENREVGSETVATVAKIGYKGLSKWDLEVLLELQNNYADLYNLYTSTLAIWNSKKESNMGVSNGRKIRLTPMTQSLIDIREHLNGNLVREVVNYLNKTYNLLDVGLRIFKFTPYYLDQHENMFLNVFEVVADLLEFLNIENVRDYLYESINTSFNNIVAVNIFTGYQPMYRKDNRVYFECDLVFNKYDNLYCDEGNSVGSSRGDSGGYDGRYDDNHDSSYNYSVDVEDLEISDRLYTILKKICLFSEGTLDNYEKLSIHYLPNGMSDEYFKLKCLKTEEEKEREKTRSFKAIKSLKLYKNGKFTVEFEDANVAAAFMQEARQIEG